MNPTRRARLQAVILEELAVFIPREVKDPRIPGSITITQVEVSTDGSAAQVMVSILGGSDDAGQISDCLQGLNSAAGFIRRHLAKILNIRHIPHLTFDYDRGLENTLRVHELLKKIEKEKKADPSSSES